MINSIFTQYNEVIRVLNKLQDQPIVQSDTTLNVYLNNNMLITVMQGAILAPDETIKEAEIEFLGIYSSVPLCVGSWFVQQRDTDLWSFGTFAEGYNVAAHNISTSTFSSHIKRVSGNEVYTSIATHMFLGLYDD